ncbi:AMP-binding protein, partial [bacterium]|nr:AMP-binding protein [bacterium]
MNKNPANFVPLTPISFLHRTADIYGEHQSVLYENRSYTWRESRERCVRIASSLNGHGVMPGDTVSVLAFNTPEMFESHFSIPMAGAILNTINIRLDAPTIAYIFDDSNAKMLFVDRELYSVASEALAIASVSPKIVVINDSFASSQPDVSSEAIDYESLVKNGSPLYSWTMPSDEWSPLSLSYTSGTTGKPK